MEGQAARGRVELLDLWRSLCVVIMVVYHVFYDTALFGRMDIAVFDSLPLLLLRYVVAGSFILISGAVSRWSRQPVKRGLFVLCAACLVGAATALMGMPVRFGVLHLIGTSMLIYAALGERLRGVSGALMPLLCAAAHFAMLALCSYFMTGVKWLWPLGFRYAGFYSADYYPLLPWLPVFLLGVWLGGVIERHADAPALSRRFPSALTFPGRHSLVIYLVHQPVLYVLCRLLFGRLRVFLLTNGNNGDKI
ncbi:MAG: DUF1624 domain-containing protein [Butyricicoccus sp.]|nr:DUF1624 domain-containing protein [Butyricicoccus sp.]